MPFFLAHFENFPNKEQKAFCKEMQNDIYSNILAIAIHSGMRIGEILALTPNDIDFENGLIHIERTLTKDDKGRIIV